ncbi:immunoglobulin domain-containing protein [Odoribacter lunatus]|uniref:immunoglobulin domain-containing protein n=1 Tax=Odoribacter lunatus TaxID=2941335 RepID=UPI002040A348|nr:hypothetical protein [Odoribacter lunatus]
MRFYVALETEAVTTTVITPGVSPDIDMAGATDFTKCFLTFHDVGTVTTTQAIIALGNIDADGSSIGSSPVNTQFVDLGGLLGLSVEFRDFDFGTLSAENVSNNYNLHIVITYDCGGINEISDNLYPAGTWDYTDKIVDFTGGKITISVPDITANMCEGSILNVSTIATVSNADGAYTIALTDGGGTNTFNPSYATVSGDNIQIAQNCPAGDYKVKATVTDAGGNTADATFAFVVSAKPNITIVPTPAATICKDDALTLSITDSKNVAKQYAWSAVGTSTDVNIASHSTFSTTNGNYTAAPQGTMTYQAIARSDAGCLDTTQLQITVNEAPSATLAASKSTVCSGETITLTATVAAGQTADSWEWVNPSSAVTANTVNVTPVNTGTSPTTITYLVKSVKGTCKSADYTATVTVNPKPNISVTNQPTPQCEGSQIDLASATLGGTTGLTLTYYSNANCTNPTSNFQTVAFADSPKSFWVVGQNTTTGCSDTVELKATVNQSPAKPTISGPTEVCKGSNATLTVAGVAGVTYKWYNASNNQVGTGTSYTTPNLTAATSYTVEAEVAGGCKTRSDAYNIAINEIPTVTISTIADACAGTDVNVSATVTGGMTPYSNYVWSMTATGGGASFVVQSNSAQVLATLGKGLNTLELTVSDAKGCTATGSQTVEGGYIQGAGLTANPATFIEGTSSSLTLTAIGVSAGNAGAITGYSYNRVNPVPAHLGNTASATYNPPLPTASTKYQVVMTTAKGCKDSAEVEVKYTAKALAWSLLKGDTVCITDLSDGAVLRAKAMFGTTPYTYTWGSIPSAAGIQTKVAQGDSLVLTFNPMTATPGTYTIQVTLTDAESKTINQSVKLVIGATPDVKINGDASADLAVCLKSTLNLTASTSLTEGVSYLWKEPSTITAPTSATQSVATTTVNTVGTTYKVIATSVYGCVDSAARKVIVNDLPTVTLTADKGSVCPGGDASVEVTSGGADTEYSWTVGGVADGGGKSKTKSITTATQFKVQRKDDNGCIATADTTIQVYVPEKLNLSEDQIVCEASSNVTLTASGLTGGSYTWSSVPNDPTLGINGTTQSVTPTQTTTYYVDGTDVHGCTVERASIVVTVDKMPTLTLSKHELAACNSVNLSTVASTTSPGALKYGSSANFTSTISPTVNTPGTHTYYVRAENGVCKTAEDTIRVTVLNGPKLEVNSPLSVCEAGSVDLISGINWAQTTYPASSITYWTDPAASTNQLTTSVVSPTTSQTYYLKGASEGCDPVIKSVKVDIEIPNVMIAGDTIVCYQSGASTTLTASGVATYNWYNASAAVVSGAGITFTPTSIGDYTFAVEGTSITGCVDTATVTVHVVAKPEVTLTGTEKVCSNEMVTLVADTTGLTNGPFTYTWTNATQTTNNEATASFASTTVKTETVKVHVTDRYGCEGPDATLNIQVNGFEATLVAANGSINLPSGSPVAVGTTVTLTAGPMGNYEYEFLKVKTPTDSLIQGFGSANTLNFVVEEITTFKVLVRNTETNCIDSATITIGIEGTPLATILAIGDTVCAGEERAVLTTVLSPAGTTGVTYSWSQVGGATLPLIGSTNLDSLVVNTSTAAVGLYRFEVSINGGVSKDTADLLIGPGIELISFKALDSCSTAVHFAIETSNATKYDWINPYNGSIFCDAAALGSGCDKATAHFTTGTVSYKIAVIASNDNCSARFELEGNIGALPEVELAENCLALHKDSIFNLNVVNPKDFDYVWDVWESSDGTTWTTGSLSGASTNPTISGVMGDKDLQYIVTASSKSVAGCKGSDTAHIYRIPDAPLTDIDTIDDKRHIQLVWGNTDWADDYTVWSRKWDPYCLTGKDGNVYTAEATGTGITALSWAEPTMDSLEFYYVTANRTICSVEYKSFETDTFGYVRHIADATDTVYTNKGQSGIYAFPYIFDMHTRYGLTYVTDFVDYILDGKHKDASNKLYISSVNAWAKDEYKNSANNSVKEAGNWGWLNDSYMVFTNRWVGMTGVSPAGTHVDLKVGLCFSISVNPGNRIEFVMFGKLRDSRDVVFDNKNVADTAGSIKSSPNICYLPFDRITLTTSQLIATGIVTKLSAIGYWNMDKRYPAQNPQSDSYITFTNKFTSESNPAMLNGYHARAGYDVLFLYVGGTEGRNSLIDFTWP